MKIERITTWYGSVTIIPLANQGVALEVTGEGRTPLTLALSGEQAMAIAEALATVVKDNVVA